MVMQVKKVTFQRMASGGKGRTENRSRVSGEVQSARAEVYIFPRKYIKKSGADRQSDNRFVPGDTAECCSVSNISI